jgi:hypothetical protein
MNKKKIVIILLFLILGIAILFGGYSRWNSANPEKTCAGCHEISPSVSEWQYSAHRGIACAECHGTALSKGVHSLKEKSNMVISHLNKKKEHEDIRLNEKQILQLSDRCFKCHRSEYAQWLSSGHSANYSRIFLNKEHNQMEKPYWDCFRCHGMFYDKSIYDLLEKPKTADGQWELKNPGKSLELTIPCLACHQMHTENEPYKKRDSLDLSLKMTRNPAISWYIRSDKRYQRADRLQTIQMFDQCKPIKVSDDPATKLCMQCHSPNFARQTCSEDDRTPTGVHEGISCTACHSPHSNSTRESCKTCHPAISNCGLDVTKMNTTFADLKSPNNIHSVSCRSCHNDNRNSKNNLVLKK